MTGGRVVTAGYVFKTIRSSEFVSQHFSVPELGIDGDAFHAKQILLQSIYRCNEEVQQAVLKSHERLNFTAPYLSIHMRRGDKITTGEAEEVAVEEYYEKAKSICSEHNIKDVFIATDDYKTVEAFRSMCSSMLEVKTLCPSSQLGYDEFRFNKFSATHKKEEMIALLTDIHCIQASHFFIGSYSSNIGRFVALQLGKEQCHSVDVAWYPT